MPANRNDITRKPIMTATPRQPRWQAVDKDGNTYNIWSADLKGARKHAKEQGWTIPDAKPNN